MQDWQEKVIIEHKELTDKIIKLIQFIANTDNIKTLSEFNFNALQRQLWAMLDYNRHLIDRIRNFYVHTNDEIK